MEQKRLLSHILNEARLGHERGDKIRVVFDIDSTLVDVAPRIERILHEFASEKEAEFPDHAPKLKDFKMGPDDYGFSRALKRLGLSEAPSEFKTALYEFWAKRFFSNDYLHHDTAHQGAVAYVREIAHYAQVTYLTGRDVDRMRIGTIKSFARLGFPIAGPQIEFALKPTADLEDASFKRDFLKASPEPAWFFDNEPENLREVLDTCPHVRGVFFDSVRLGDAPVPEGIPSIRSFER